MQRMMVRGALVAALLTAGVARPASADWLLTPYLGVVFGQDADFGDAGDFETNFERRMIFGASIAWMGAGVAGLEFDIGTAPNFFEMTGPGGVQLDDTNVTTFMVNLVLGAPIGGQRGVGFRPYVAGGAGLLRSRIRPGQIFNDLDRNDLGINAGGGIIVFFADNVGLRGDLRYFRSLQEDRGTALDLGLADFDFWRGTAGLTIRF